MQETRSRILGYLREQDQASVADLAAFVSLAPVTVRHHLNVLRKRGLVEVEAEPVGRGRPRHLFRLSPDGGAVVTEDRYQEMAGRLLSAMKAGSREAAEDFFRDMADRLLEERVDSLRQQPVPARLDAVSELLAEEGFTVRWERDGDDYLVHEIACPYQQLGAEHAEVCCMDRRLLEQVVEGTVTRERWRVDGDAECVYRITPSSPSTAR